MLDIIEGLLAAIQRIEGELTELVTQDTRLDKDAKLLCSTSGIGFSSAVVIAAETGDISLFRKPKQLAAYFGLEPGEDNPAHTGTLQCCVTADLLNYARHRSMRRCSLRRKEKICVQAHSFRHEFLIL